MSIRLSLPKGSNLRFKVELGPNGLDRRLTANDKAPLNEVSEPAFHRRSTDHVTVRRGNGMSGDGKSYENLGGYLA